MTTFLALFTSFAYLFIITMYTIKAVKFLRLPTHIRWDLYPVIHEENYAYGGSMYERKDWWVDIKHKRMFRSIVFFLKEYLSFPSYFKWNKSYWFFLYVCHVGFVMLMVFQVLSFVSAIAVVSGTDVAAESSYYRGRILHRLVFSSGIICFVSGIIGSIGLFMKRLTDKDLRAYASPEIYFGYVFNLALSATGLYVWYFHDSSFSQYTGFWKGLITFHPEPVEPAVSILIVMLALHLIYLPFTRAFHYISRIFAFFLIRWDDEPNLRGSALEKRLLRLFTQKVSWSAPHVHPGKSWGKP